LTYFFEERFEYNISKVNMTSRSQVGSLAFGEDLVGVVDEASAARTALTVWGLNDVARRL
jgi:hypothetical protein